ncbi:rubrerythrin family protein [Halobacteriaceae bacterium SHR40]|uniref:rubrerythrin family protein n=1 Tax=Halovenus amylolytica TaxID=2500550 RepID=UPI000FE3A2EF
MDGPDFVDRIESDLQTELSRLGSSKSLYADTVGEMEPEAVLTAAANAAAHASDTFAQWAGSTEQDLFTDANSRVADQYDEIVGELDDHEPGEPPAAAVSLREAQSTPERLGATVGWTLVMERKSTQSSGFFTGQAKPQTASIFRSFGDAYETTREEALSALEAVCDSEEEWDRAVSAATAVVEAAYDEYFETLEELGMNPKPVC